jgi:NitT/TauT family transport system substrate-binding protein
MRKIALILSLLSAFLLISACASPAAKPADEVTLRMAVLPILDKLPMVVAQQQGLFAAHGVKVEFIEIQSAPERDQLIAAGQADGMINELVSTLFYNKDQVRVQIVRYAAAAAPDAPLFSIVASGKSGIQDAQGLKGAEIGISQGTVIEYLTDRLLKAEGLQAAEIKTIAVPKIGDRLALLSAGELKAGTLPEPLSSLAVQQGGKVVLDDSAHPDYSFSTIAFRKEVIDQHPEAIRAFLAAIEEATVLINKDPNQWKALLLEQKILPQPLAETFQVRKFVTAGAPNEAQWNDSLAWAKEKGLIDKDVPYASSVNDSFLPK